MLKLEVIDYKDGTSMVNHIYYNNELLASFERPINKINFHCLDNFSSMPMTIVRYQEEDDGQFCISKIQERFFEGVTYDKDGIGILKYS